MKLFKSGGIAFYTLAPGESYPDAGADKDYVGAYVIFPYESQWYTQIHHNGTWKDFTQQSFDSENAAFNYAYEHFIARQAKIRAAIRGE